MINKNDEAYKTISEVAELLNLVNTKTGKISTHTLRFWEKEFKQIKPRIFAGNRRYYDTKTIEIIKELQTTFQTPTMAPFCKDEEKYEVVNLMIEEIKELKKKGKKIDGQLIEEILTVNGVRFSLEDGSWGLIRASSNKPSLVVVTESTSSDQGKKKIFEFIDSLLQKTGKIGKYDQKI